jgi:hypothetical protein
MHFVTANTLSDNVDGIFHKDLYPSKNYGARIKRLCVLYGESWN